MEQPKRTIEACIANVSVEGEVAPEHALVLVDIVGVHAPIKGRKVLQPDEARVLSDSLGAGNYYAMKGQPVMADYEGQELKRVYTRTNP